MVKTHHLSGGAGNVLDLENLTRSFNDFYRDYSRIDQLVKDGGRLSKYLDFIVDIAKQVELSGNVVYYPFGGTDVKHPFLMVEGVKDVFSQGKNKFGSIKSLENFMKYASSYDKSAMTGLSWMNTQYLNFLETGDNQNFSGWTFPSTNGVGGLAVADIISILEGKVIGIHYYEINDKGKPIFIPESDLQRDKSYDNALIRFTDKSRRVKRFWYSKYDFNGDSSDKEKFKGYVGKINLDVLFIKGAIDIFSEEDPEWREQLFDLILDPAKDLNAMVITDERTDRHGFPLKIYQEEGDRNHPIWKHNDGPRIINLPWGIGHFEYGYGKTVYVGSGSNLIDSDTPLSEVKGYE
jgi:hypothetical protein